MSKEKYLTKSDVAKLLGMTSTGLELAGFYDELENHSVHPRFPAYAESEVLAKKGAWLAEKEERKRSTAKRLGEARRGKSYSKKKTLKKVALEATDPLVVELYELKKQLNRVIRHVLREDE